MFSSRWSKFHGDLVSYRRKVEAALVVHGLIRELEEVRDRANEKVSHMITFDPEELPSLCDFGFSLQNKSTAALWKQNHVD